MKTGQLLLLILMSTAFVFGTTATAPTGAGTSSGDPYIISSLANLSWICQNDTKWGSSYYYKQTANISASETQYWDDNDSDLDGDLYNDAADLTATGNNEGWLPLGDSSPLFSAHYDGQGYTIDGLTISRSATDYIGFIGYTSGATISDLGVTNVDISGKAFVAAIVGWNTASTTISKCFSTGAVTGAGNYAGGLAGYNKATISLSYTSCSVTNSSGYTGGFVGQNYGDGNISNCYSTGAVSGGERTGGFVGYNTSYPASISNSYSIGSVSSTGTAGGFCATNSYTISNCFFDNQTSLQSSSDGGTAKTTSQMKDFTTFTDAAWDFVSETANGSNDYWDADQAGNVNSGYVILAWQDGADTSLPVELSAFSAKSNSGAIDLEWQTSSEVENLGFILERRKAGYSEPDIGWQEIVSFKTNPALIGQGSTTLQSTYKFTDITVNPGERLEYCLSDVDYQGKVTTHNTLSVLVLDPDHNLLPGSFKVDAIYPNPFNPGTTISYTLTMNSKISVSILDVRGRTVRTLSSDQMLIAGPHSLYWDGSDANGQHLCSGIYLVQINSGAMKQVNKIVMID